MLNSLSAYQSRMRTQNAFIGVCLQPSQAFLSLARVTAVSLRSVTRLIGLLRTNCRCLYDAWDKRTPFYDLISEDTISHRASRPA
jgi:hypothetical protein